MMTYEEVADFLAHHGIKGQKWGVRRFQNEDGSLTPAGQARYDKLQKEVDALAIRTAEFGDMHNELKKNRPTDGSALLVPKDYKEAYDKAVKDVVKSLDMLEKYGDVMDREGTLDSGEHVVQIILHDNKLNMDITSMARMNWQSDEIKHWGISGQKWGQRRYQNPDGTYTEIGKIRKNASRSNVSDDYKRSRSKKNAKTMSNEELRFATERRNLENQYKNSKHPKYDSTTIGRGQKFLEGLAGLAASAAAVKKVYSPVIKPAVKKVYSPVIKPAVDKFLSSVGKIPVVDKVLDSVGKTVFKKGIVIL